MAAPARLLLHLSLGLSALAGHLIANDTPSGENCSFRSDPDRFLSQQSRAYHDVHDRVRKFAGRASRSSVGEPVSANTIPKRNFIDEEIFGTMSKAGVTPARLTTDEEFVRRIYLDLTGRVPTSQQVRNFIADKSPSKRDALIDQLLFSGEFVDKWTQWMGDLLGNVRSAANININAPARNNFHTYIKVAVAENKSIATIARDVITAKGNTYLDNGATGFIPIQQATNGGPDQDRYDQLFYRTSAIFLGMSHYDCILCHSGRGHLDQVSLWGKRQIRTDAQEMAAFFSHMNRATQQGSVQPGQTPAMPVGSIMIPADRTTGNAYMLNTNFGNRPNRVAVNGTNQIQPKYRVTGATPKSTDWRSAFADNLVQDPMFARNFANRFWKATFNLGLVDPVDTLDPDRLDPNNPPTGEWSLQATHPVLLERLAQELVRLKFDMREFLRLLVQSNAYQLSSRYDDEWKLEYVPLFARHFPRRLDSEEVADAIVTVTGVPQRYQVNDWGDTAEWAMQLPDPLEPVNNNATSLLNAFLRGNRDTTARSQSGSILQQLSLMNDRFVLDRIRYNVSPVLQRIAFQGTNEQVVDELFLAYLARVPAADEKQKAVAYLAKATNRNAAIEDLAWACLNKVEFLYSY